MEASTAAPAAPQAPTADPNQAGQQGLDPNQQQVQEGPDVGQWQQSIDTRLDTALDGMRELATLVQTRMPEPQQEQAPDFEQQFNELIEQGGGLIDPTQLNSLMEQRIEHGIQQAIAPVMQQMQGFQQQMTSQELQGLQTDFPEIADPTRDARGQTAADRLADAVVGQVMDILPQNAPQEFAEGLMQNAKFVRLVHLAEKARSQAQQETPAGTGQQMPQIETGGGAAPTSTGGADQWDQFIASRRPNGGRAW